MESKGRKSPATATTAITWAATSVSHARCVIMNYHLEEIKLLLQNQWLSDSSRQWRARAENLLPQLLQLLHGLQPQPPTPAVWLWTPIILRRLNCCYKISDYPILVDSDCGWQATIVNLSLCSQQLFLSYSGLLQCGQKEFQQKMIQQCMYDIVNQERSCIAD
jgi:hypothetical protein